MQRRTGALRAAPALALLLALACAAPAGAAIGGPAQPDGWGNVVRYSLCAALVATAATPYQAISAAAYCYTLYRDAV